MAGFVSWSTTAGSGLLDEAQKLRRRQQISEEHSDFYVVLANKNQARTEKLMQNLSEYQRSGMIEHTTLLHSRHCPPGQCKDISNLPERDGLKWMRKAITDAVHTITDKMNVAYRLPSRTIAWQLQPRQAKITRRFFAFYLVRLFCDLTDCTGSCSYFAGKSGIA